MTAARRPRLNFMRARKGYKQVRLLREHPSGVAFQRVVTPDITRGFYIARVKEQTGGKFVDKLLIDESDIVTETIIKQVQTVDLVMSNNNALRYSVDGGFVIPIGKTRRFIATLRLNQSDESPINV